MTWCGGETVSMMGRGVCSEEEFWEAKSGDEASWGMGSGVELFTMGHLGAGVLITRSPGVVGLAWRERQGFRFCNGGNG
jgi:hypothetical protein